MTNIKRLLVLCLLITLLYLAFPPPAYGYLDPGTGSYIFQLLIAGLAGSLFLVKLYWKKIATFFTKKTGTDEDEESKEEKGENV